MQGRDAGEDLGCHHQGVGDADRRTGEDARIQGERAGKGHPHCPMWMGECGAALDELHELGKGWDGSGGCGGDEEDYEEHREGHRQRKEGVSRAGGEDEGRDTVSASEGGSWREGKDDVV